MYKVYGYKNKMKIPKKVSVDINYRPELGANFRSNLLILLINLLGVSFQVFGVLYLILSFKHVFITI